MKRKSRALAAAVVAFAMAQIAAAPAAHAGFFDFLFGAQQRSSYQPQPMVDPAQQTRDLEAQKARRAAQERASEARSAERAARDREAIKRLADVARTQGPRAAFAQDPTLRPGDIVVMNSGIEVYEGGNARSGRLFRPLDESRMRNRNDLQQLQKVSRLAPQVPLAERPALVINQRGGKASIHEAKAADNAGAAKFIAVEGASVAE